MSHKLSRRQILKITGGFVTGVAVATLPSYVKAQGYFRKKPAVRKNIQSLTSHEKAAFVNAIKATKNTFTQGSTVSVYDQIVDLHVEAMGFMSEFQPTGPAAGFSPAHDLPAFLPWHRELVYRLEQALQLVDPTVTIPYWDWTDPKALDVMFQDDFLGPNGEGVTIEVPGKGFFQGGPVISGPFSEANGWVLNPGINIDNLTLESRGTSLTRFIKVPPLDEYPVSEEYLNRVLGLDDYLTFRAALEGWVSVDEKGNSTPDWKLHNYMHGVIGGASVKDINATPSPDNWTKILGTMNNITSSPYEPAFWLNHSNVDRLWAEWQDNGHMGSEFYPAFGQPYGHNLNDPMWPWDGGQSIPGNFGQGNALSLLPHFDPNDIVTPADVLDFRKLGYTYDTLIHSDGSHWQNNSGRRNGSSKNPNYVPPTQRYLGM